MGAKMVKRKRENDGETVLPYSSDSSRDNDLQSLKKMDIEGDDFYHIPNGHSQDPFDLINLPEEVQGMIFRRLRISHLRNLRLTCKKVKEVVDKHACVLEIPFLRNLSDTSESYEEEFNIFLKNHPMVEGISIRSIIVDKILPSLPKSLLHLHLVSCRRITDDSLVYLPRNLVLLNLTNCIEITDSGLQHLPEDLRYLNLGNCIYVSDEGIAKLPRGLSYLNLYGCSNVSADGLKNLPPNLRYLNISYCKVGSDSLKYIPDGCHVIHNIFAT